MHLPLFLFQQNYRLVEVKLVTASGLQISKNMDQYQCFFRTHFDQHSSKNQYYLRILFREHQGSVLGPVLLNTFSYSQLFVSIDIYLFSHADDNTPFFLGADTDNVKSKLQKAKKSLLQGLSHIQRKANSGKCHFICSSNINIMQKNKEVSSSSCEQLFNLVLTKNDITVTYRQYLKLHVYNHQSSQNWETCEATCIYHVYY